MRRPTCATLCYGIFKTWKRREDAIDFFAEGVRQSEGAEKERYLSVLAKLMNGEVLCSDEELENSF